MNFLIFYRFVLFFFNFSIFLIFFLFFFLIFGLFEIFEFFWFFFGGGIPFKFAKVTTKSYQGYYWAPKIAKNGSK